ncbi:MAG: FAD-dependent oxidoreductase [Candidatus Woesearchaeota archaeon]
MKKPVFESKLLYKRYVNEDLLVVGFAIDDSFSFKAGQFFHIILDNNNPDDERVGFRPYSILNSPDDAVSRKIVESFIKLFPGGLASEFIKKLEVGETVHLRGPFGKFQLDKSNSEHVFLCTGTGITPINSIILQNIHSGNEMILFYSAKKEDELLHHDIFSELGKKHANFKYYPTLTRTQDDLWNGLKGRIPLHLDIINNPSSKNFYICGQKDFIIDILPLIKEKSKNIIIERYD